jgi:hypothetical protein
VTRLTKQERDRALDYGKKKPQASVDEILEEAKAFKEEAINWLRANHPDLLKEKS